VTNSQVVLGKVYNVKVSGKVQPVRLVGESRFGGWDGVNTNTGRAVRIRTAAKLRGLVLCGKCANCQHLIASKQSFRTALSSTNDPVAREAIRKEWQALCDQALCTEGGNR